MADVEWAGEALEAVAEIHRRVAVDKPMAAARLVRDIRDAGQSLALFPSRGRLLDDGARELTHLNPYIIRYDYDPRADSVTILTVWHGARNDL